MNVLVGRALEALAGQAPFVLCGPDAAKLAPELNERVGQHSAPGRSEEWRALWAPVRHGIEALLFALVAAGVSAGGGWDEVGAPASTARAPMQPSTLACPPTPNLPRAGPAPVQRFQGGAAAVHAGQAPPAAAEPDEPAVHAAAGGGALGCCRWVTLWEGGLHLLACPPAPAASSSILTGAGATAAPHLAGLRAQGL